MESFFAFLLIESFFLLFFFDLIFQHLVDIELIFIIYSVCFLCSYRSFKQISFYLVGVQFYEHLFLLLYH